nr:1-phosphofructokinase family hexose kinase [Leucobacter weissii]
MITVTPAPAIDWTVEVEGWEFGAVHRARSERREPSGKGVNVSVALHRAGRATHAVLVAAGDGVDFMDRELAALGVPHSFASGGPVRTNLTLLVDGRADTKVNTSGAALSDSQSAALIELVSDLADRPGAAILTAGSLPAGSDARLHARIVERARERGRYAALDTSGAALLEGIAAGPDLVKPNAQELAELVAAPVATLGEVRDAAHELRGRHGVGSVLVSLGADGALLVDADGELWAGARPDRVRNAVGAGDAMLAGFLSARSDRERALRAAVLWGGSAVAHASTFFEVLPEDRFERWCTDRIDRSYALGLD